MSISFTDYETGFTYDDYFRLDPMVAEAEAAGWDEILQSIEDELAEIEAWADYEARQHWRDDIEDVPFPSLEETWAELNSPEHIEMQARYGLTDF